MGGKNKRKGGEPSPDWLCPRKKQGAAVWETKPVGGSEKSTTTGPLTALGGGEKGGGGNAPIAGELEPRKEGVAFRGKASSYSLQF